MTDLERFNQLLDKFGFAKWQSMRCNRGNCDNPDCYGSDECMYQLGVARAELTAFVESLVLDEKRLDYLQKRGATIEIGNNDTWIEPASDTLWSLFRPEGGDGDFDSLHEAIDAAMQQEDKK